MKTNMISCALSFTARLSLIGGLFISGSLAQAMNSLSCQSLDGRQVLTQDYRPQLITVSDLERFTPSGQSIFVKTASVMQVAEHLLEYEKDTDQREIQDRLKQVIAAEKIALAAKPARPVVDMYSMLSIILAPTGSVRMISTDLKPASEFEYADRYETSRELFGTYVYEIDVEQIQLTKQGSGRRTVVRETHRHAIGKFRCVLQTQPPTPGRAG